MAYVTNAERIGKEQGIQEGAMRKGQNVALKMLQEGFDRETICRLTELSEEELQTLEAQTKNSGKK